ncbi:MAG: ImmA/IrrE family metallo-endopeptidase [Mesorhizobium sp.]|uniref:ImmA/IrrE family metallo-endopeptidase n=1 Tax=Mesorhizobium sp. TaxID=1871066 RepID=UPI000FE73E14|nr:ImmA/IrrE family metallo-endopeptidase [Mesorhizobium sp.]RWB19931.1 MAG: ImmA/IrrE family metallo-endopeptidase [Mesorhizobium sp.]
MRNIILSRGTASDIESQVNKVLRGLGNPEPPLRLQDVRDLLKLDRAYYSTTDDGFLREKISKLTIAGAQVLKRPGLLLEAVRKFDLRALYLPDCRRILLDRSQPDAKQRWNEAHEVGHSLLPWHADLMLGDHEQTVTPSCHAQIEAEANYAAGQLLFLQTRFLVAANDSSPDLDTVRSLKACFGNTFTTTFWRFVESAHSNLPMIGLIGANPNFPKRSGGEAVRYVIESPAYRKMFESLSVDHLQAGIASYCRPSKAGPLGSAEIVFSDRNGEAHVFLFESFSNTYDCLTLAVYQRPHRRVVGF